MTPTLHQRQYKILSGSVLKLLAIITMTIDHAAIILLPVVGALRLPITFLGTTKSVYWLLRKIGRLAFPIFCFLIAQGYQHTRNKWKYGLRLLIFAVVSEIPFDLMCTGKLWSLEHQNVYFTLFMGLAMIFAYENINGQLRKYLAMAAIGLVATYLKADYGLNGVLLVFLLHWLRQVPAVQALLAYPLLSGGAAAFAAFIPINLYNGERGFIKGPVLKWLFYIFYPLHMVVLLAIQHLLK